MALVNNFRCGKFDTLQAWKLGDIAALSKLFRQLAPSLVSLFVKKIQKSVISKIDGAVFVKRPKRDVIFHVLTQFSAQGK